jgi:hypothetical protein
LKGSSSKSSIKTGKNISRDSSFNPTLMEKQTVIENKDKGKEVAKDGHFVFLAGSDHKVPENIGEALWTRER